MSDVTKLVETSDTPIISLSASSLTAPLESTTKSDEQSNKLE